MLIDDRAPDTDALLSSLPGEDIVGWKYLNTRDNRIVPAEEIHPDLELTFGAVLVALGSGTVVRFYNEISFVERLTVEPGPRSFWSSDFNPRRVSTVSVARERISIVSASPSLWSVYFEFNNDDSPLCICLGDATDSGQPRYLPDSICVITDPQVASHYSIPDVPGNARGIHLAPRL